MDPAVQKTSRRNRPHLRKLAAALLLVLVLLAVSGCRTISFYAQAIKGQYQILGCQQPVDQLIADPATPAALKKRLELVQTLRTFAGRNLALPIDNHYRKYADVRRPFVVWNVEAAPEFSLQPKTWWYPLVGSLSYHGYFSLAGATNYAAYLRKKGYDVSVGDVGAYSTLGWFKDPVLNTFIFEEDGELAETLFHELAHQRVFASGDTDFNEAFATTVGQEGALRWLQSQGDPARVERYRAHLRRTREFAALVTQTRLELVNVYGDERTPDGKIRATTLRRNVPPAELRRQKQRVLAEMHQRYTQLKTRWNGNAEYDAWFAHALNNAHLNAVTAYYDQEPGFEQLLRLNGGDLAKFYNSVERLAAKPKKQRHEFLRSLGKARAGS